MKISGVNFVKIPKSQLLRGSDFYLGLDGKWQTDGVFHSYFVTPEHRTSTTKTELFRSVLDIAVKNKASEVCFYFPPEIHGWDVAFTKNTSKHELMMKEIKMSNSLSMYVQEVIRTTPNIPPSEIINLAALGLAGETGEVIDIIKKYRFHDKPLDKEHLTEELGDVFWYFVLLANAFKIPLDEIMDYNTAKLQKRFPNGFNKEDARNRKDKL